MLNGLKKKVKAKLKYKCAPCPCGCGSTSSSTIADHKKHFIKAANADALRAARSISGPTSSSTPGPATTDHASHRKLPRSMQSAKDPTPDDSVEMDLVQASGLGSSEPTVPAIRLWPNRASRRERRDEDLVDSPGPSSPQQSEDEAENNGNNDSDEPEFMSDDEGPVRAHVGISVTEQLTADFQARTVKAGASLVGVVHCCACFWMSDFIIRAGAHG
jgi:hypothetical protein